MTNTNEMLSALSSKDIIDYLLIIIPIVLSTLAIWISIITARKQNKIALFELRYKCYSQLGTIYSFATSIHDCEDPAIILKLFDALWGTHISETTGIETIIRARCQMEIISHDVLPRNFLFRHTFDSDFGKILTCMQETLLSATDGIVNYESVNELHRLCETFEQKDAYHMRKKLKI